MQDDTTPVESPKNYRELWQLSRSEHAQLRREVRKLGLRVVLLVVVATSAGVAYLTEVLLASPSPVQVRCGDGYQDEK